MKGFDLKLDSIIWAVGGRRLHCIDTFERKGHKILMSRVGLLKGMKQRDEFRNIGL